jgi:hypothetical protein
MYMSTIAPQSFIHIQCMKNFINYNQYECLCLMTLSDILHLSLICLTRPCNSSFLPLCSCACHFYLQLVPLSVLISHAIILDINNRDDDLFASYTYFSTWLYNGNDLQHADVRNEVIVLSFWFFCWILEEYVVENDGRIVLCKILFMICKPGAIVAYGRQ